MNAARAPSETNHWDSLDIFLFSNGQEYSPPRKYHLHYDDLFFWQATLDLLARSQYGTERSGINLFTLSGHIINTPLELTNNGTYVAVAPPDEFIPAGYANYLIKASKSWERRHSKKITSSDSVEKAGEISIQSGVSSAGNQEIISIKTPDQDITISTVSKSNVDNDPGIPEKLEPAIVINGVAGTIKPNERKKTGSQPSPIETRTSILRKLTNTSNMAQSPYTNRRNSSNIKRRDSKDPKGNVKVIAKSNATPTSTSFDKTPTKLPKTLENAAVPSTNLERTNNFTRLSHASEIRKSDNKESKVMSKTDDKDIILISNVIRSIDEVSSNFVDAKDVLSKRRDSPHFQIPISEESSEKHIMPLIEEILVRSNAAVSVPQFSIPNNAEKTTSSKQSYGESIKERKKSDDYFATVLNKGESVNLKLNIEVRNGECTVQPVINNSPIKVRSLTEVRIEPAPSNKTNPDMIITKSFESLFTSDSNDCCRKCPKVAVVKCPCQTQTNISSGDAKTYFIIVPIVTRSVKEWNKEPDGKIVSEKEVQCTASCSKVNRPVVQSDCNHQGVECDGDCHTQRPCCTLDRNEYVTIQRVATRSNNFALSHYVFATQISKEDSQNVEFKPVACMNAICKDFQDKETQTEWCSLLLEVRRHEEGHYSFHLPPLEVLKTLNLLL